MTVTANTTRNDYLAGNNQNVYNYTFQLNDAADVTVILNGVIQTLNVHYTVQNVGVGTGGTITFTLVDSNNDPIFPTQGQQINILMTMELDRDTSYQPNGAFLASDVNNDYDRLWLAENQQQTAINRSLRLQDKDATSGSMELPLKASRLNRMLAFDSVTGEPIAGPDVTSVTEGLTLSATLINGNNTNGNDIVFNDNDKAKFGTGSDLEIYHDGNNSIIKESGTGAFYILNSSNERMLTTTNSGAIELYHSDDIKLSTTANGVDVTGAITVSGNVDGRNISADGIKLDGIEALADVTDTDNVTTAGALMDSEITNLAQVKAFDSSDYATAAQGTTADSALPKSGGVMTGAITTNSTFDGRDVATDGTKLDGIEASADVTDATNVTAAGALMDSEVTNLAQVKAFSSSDYATAAQGTTADNALPKSGGTLTGDLNLGASDKVVFNTNFEIYRDASNAIISETGAGSLILRGTNLSLQSDDNDQYLQAIENGGVTLYHQTGGASSPKVSTTNSGIDVTGTVKFDGLEGTNSVNVTQVLDEDSMSSNSATSLSTQQSIKSYVDTAIAGVPQGDITGVTAGTNLSGGGTSGAVTLDLDNNISLQNITLTGYLRGPSNFTIDPAAHGDDTGTLVVAGNLQVDGTTTTINSTTVEIADLNFKVAKNATSNAEANTGGFTVGGSNAELKYLSSGDKWTMNKDLDVSGSVTADSLNISGTSNLGSVDIYDSGSNAVVAADSGHALQLRGRSGQNVNVYAHGALNTVFNSTGIDVTGTATMDGLTSHTGSNATDIASLSGSAAGRALKIQSYDTSIAGSGFDINASGSAGEITLQTYAKDRLRIGATGEISFYEDTGTTPKMVWDSSRESLGIGQAPTSALHVINSSNSGESIATLEAASTKNGYVYINADDNRRKSLVFQSGGVDKFSMGVGDSDELSASSFFIGSGKTGGSGADLVINSSGNATFSGSVTSTGLTVDTSAGQLDVEALGGSSVKVKSDGSLKIEATGGSVSLINGSTEVLSTTSSGIDVSGTVTANSGGGNASLGSHLNLGDNQKARFGASDDLEIYHDGSNSIIKDSGTGILRYTSSNASTAGVVFEIENTDSTNLSGSFIHFKDSLGITPAKIGAYANELYIMRGSNNDRILTTNSGAAELYYSDDEKLATTATGISVDGTVTADGLTVNSGTSDTVATFQSSDQFADLALTDSGGTSYIRQSNGSLILEADRANASASTAMLFKLDSAEAMRIDSSGRVGIGNSGPQAGVHITQDNTQLILAGAAMTNDKFIAFDVDLDADIDTHFITVDQADALAFGEKLNDNDRVIENEWMRITNAGKVGIGVVSPDSKLHISNNAAPANDLTLLTLQNGNGTSDISTPDTFIDFVFKDSNANVTPQARIAAHAGDGSDANTQILEGKGYLTFHTSDTTAESGVVAPPERLRIGSDGKVGINNPSPAQMLHLTSTGFAYARLNNSSYTGIDIGQHTGGNVYFNLRDDRDLIFQTNNTEAMRIDASGTISSGAITATGSGTTSSTNTAVFHRNGGETSFKVRDDGVVLVPSSYLYVNNNGGFYSDGAIRARGGITNDGGNALSISSGSADITFNSKNLTSVGTINSGAVTIDTDNQSGGALRIEANQTNPEQDFYFAQEIVSTLSGSTTTTGDRAQGGLWIDLNSSATGGDTSNEHRAYGVYADVDSTGDADLVVGGYFNATATPTTGTTSSVMGGYFFGEDNGGAGAVTNVYGLQSFAFSDNSTSDANWLYGLYTKAYNAADSGNIGGSVAVYGEIEIPSGTADIYGNSYVFRAEYDNNGTVSQTNSTYLFYGNYAGVLPTTAYGLYIADAVTSHFGGGNLTGVGGIALGDNDKATFGVGDDLQIYHNGNNSFIEDAGTGSLYVRASSDFRVQSYSDNKEMIRATADGAVTLYHNNSTKLATTATGIDVTGGISIGDAKTVGHRDISLKYDLVYMTAGVISPADDDGSDNDNSVDLGKSAARFNDIYATNSTIQTSDRNEKQDIEQLSDAEQRVAVACKSLLRKFRWKSAVEEKGDDARIHFGIIAQDLQDAFETEGLDAGRYAMFISSTWTDEETGEEKTRMGVRYSELLAFIISAI